MADKPSKKSDTNTSPSQHDVSQKSNDTTSKDEQNKSTNVVYYSRYKHVFDSGDGAAILNIGRKTDKIPIHPMCVAVSVGHIGAISKMVNAGMNLDETFPNTNGCTSLHVAIQQRKLDVIRCLLKHGANLNISNHCGDTPLMLAVRTGKKDIVNEIWHHRAKLDVNARNKKGCSIVHLAALYKWESALTMFLKGGSDVNAQDVEGNTALLSMAMKGSISTMHVLLEHRANMLCENNNHLTALCVAIKSDKPELPGILINIMNAEERSEYVQRRVTLLKEIQHTVENASFFNMSLFNVLVFLWWDVKLVKHIDITSLIDSWLGIISDFHKSGISLIVALSHFSVCMVESAVPELHTKVTPEFMRLGGPALVKDLIKSYAHDEDITGALVLLLVPLAECDLGTEWIKDNYMSLVTAVDVFNTEIEFHFASTTSAEVASRFSKNVQHFQDTFKKIQEEGSQQACKELLDQEKKEKEKKTKTKKPKASLKTSLQDSKENPFPTDESHNDAQEDSTGTNPHPDIMLKNIENKEHSKPQQKEPKKRKKRKRKTKTSESRPPLPQQLGKCGALSNLNIPQKEFHRSTGNISSCSSSVSPESSIQEYSDDLFLNSSASEGERAINLLVRSEDLSFVHPDVMDVRVCQHSVPGGYAENDTTFDGELQFIGDAISSTEFSNVSKTAWMPNVNKIQTQKDDETQWSTVKSSRRVKDHQTSKFPPVNEVHCSPKSPKEKKDQLTPKPIPENKDQITPKSFLKKDQLNPKSFPNSKDQLTPKSFPKSKDQLAPKYFPKNNDQLTPKSFPEKKNHWTPNIEKYFDEEKESPAPEIGMPEEPNSSSPHGRDDNEDDDNEWTPKHELLQKFEWNQQAPRINLQDTFNNTVTADYKPNPVLIPDIQVPSHLLDLTHIKGMNLLVDPEEEFAELSPDPDPWYDKTTNFRRSGQSFKTKQDEQSVDMFSQLLEYQRTMAPQGEVLYGYDQNWKNRNSAGKINRNPSVLGEDMVKPEKPHMELRTSNTLNHGMTDGDIFHQAQNDYHRDNVNNLCSQTPQSMDQLSKDELSCTDSDSHDQQQQIAVIWGNRHGGKGRSVEYERRDVLTRGPRTEHAEFQTSDCKPSQTRQVPQIVDKSLTNNVPQPRNPYSRSISIGDHTAAVSTKTEKLPHPIPASTPAPNVPVKLNGNISETPQQLSEALTFSKNTAMQSLMQVANKNQNNKAESCPQGAALSYSADTACIVKVAAWSKWKSAYDAFMKMQWVFKKRINQIAVARHPDHYIVGRGAASDSVVMMGQMLNGSEVAVKRIPLSLAIEQQDNIIKLITAKLQHKNVIPFLHFEMDVEHGYIVSEMCEFNLHQRIENLKNRAHLGPEIGLHLNKELVQAVDYLHFKNIVHGRLKPENVLIDMLGRIRLTDYGYANAEKGLPVKYLSENVLWQSTDRVGYHADIQSCGLLMFFILTGGEHPFEDSHHYILEHLVQKRTRSLKNISEEAEDLLRVLLFSPPAARPASNKILKHPYFLTSGERLDMMLTVWNELCSKQQATHALLQDHLSRQTLYAKAEGWIDHIRGGVLFKVQEEMLALRQGQKYEDTLLGLLEFMGNITVCMPTFLSEDVKKELGDPAPKFCGLFPQLALCLYKVMRSVTAQTRKMCFDKYL